MANSIAFARNYTTAFDEMYQRASVSSCLNSPRRMARGAQRQGDHDPEDRGYGTRGLRAQCGIQDGLDHLRVRDEDVQLRLRRPPARRRACRAEGRHERDGRSAGDRGLALPVHHADAQGHVG